jgi:hypothetical protein
MIIIPANPVVYRGTITGLRISSVNGTAFLDACAALVPYADGLHRVEIYDSAGRQLVGYLSAQGTGETLDVELSVDAWVNEDSSYETFTAGAGNLITQAINSTGNGYCLETFSGTLNALYKCVNGITLTSGTMPGIYWGGSSVFVGPNFTANNTSYRTQIDIAGVRGFRITSSAATNYALTAMSLKQVLTPSTNGIVVVSTKSGAVPNFASKNASFTYNAASYTVIVRKVR